MAYPNRIAAFRSLEHDAYYGPMIWKLPTIVVVFIRGELEKTTRMTSEEYAVHVRNLFIGVENKPSNWAVIDEILTVCDSKAVAQAKAFNKLYGTTDKSKKENEE